MGFRETEYGPSATNVEAREGSSGSTVVPCFANASTPETPKPAAALAVTTAAARRRRLGRRGATQRWAANARPAMTTGGT